MVFFHYISRIIGGDEKGGLRELARGIHMHPTVGELWRHLCLFVLQFAPDHARVAANAAEVAALATPRDRKSLALATLGYLVAGRHRDALRSRERSKTSGSYPAKFVCTLFPPWTVVTKMEKFLPKFGKIMV
jgi:hypothetical protein